MNAIRRPRMRVRSGELGRAVISLTLAFGLWFVVGDENDAEILAGVPLELRNLPPGLEVVDQSVNEVAVRLRGSSRLLREVPLPELRAFVNLAGETPGERTWYLSAEAVEAPAGVQVMRVEPSTLRLRLDRTVTRSVLVSPRVLGEPASDFEIYSIQIEPRELSIEGPESLLRDLQQVTTEPISADGLRESYTRRLGVEVDPALRPSVRRVELELRIGAEREAMEFEIAVRRDPLEANDPVGCELAPESIRAVVRVPPELVARVSPETLFAEVSCSGLPPGEHERVPELAYPDGPDAAIQVTSFEPEQVDVRVGQPGIDRNETPAWDDP